MTDIGGVAIIVIGTLVLLSLFTNTKLKFVYLFFTLVKMGRILLHFEKN
jgi:hypothetical protein